MTEVKENDIRSTRIDMGWAALISLGLGVLRDLGTGLALCPLCLQQERRERWPGKEEAAGLGGSCPWACFFPTQIPDVAELSPA